MRGATQLGTLAGGADSLVVAKTATEQVEHVRVAPLPGGNFAIFVRWANIAGTMGPGRIDMYRANNAGVIQGAPMTVTTRSGSDFASSESFGVAAHGDGSIFVVWSSCLRTATQRLRVFVAGSRRHTIAATEPRDQARTIRFAVGRRPPRLPALVAAAWTESPSQPTRRVPRSRRASSIPTAPRAESYS